MADPQPSEKMLDRIRSFVTTQIRAGFAPPSEIAAAAVEVVLDGGGDDGVATRHAERCVAEALAELGLEQETWPAVTDCDRLDEAFAALDAGGITARQDFTCCQTCGHSEIRDEVEAARTHGRSVRGYAFYHRQDTENATERDGLYIAYGATEPGDEAEAAVGATIAATLRAGGLEVAWDGSHKTRIFVKLHWQRRRGPEGQALLSAQALAATAAALEDERRAESGDVDAQLCLAARCLTGDGVAVDPVRAVAWYRRAAEQGLAEAQFRLGACYRYGTGVGEDLPRAIEWYRRAAEQEHAVAQFILGCSYDRGIGVEEDHVLAADWYRKAAELGHAVAQYNLGVSYDDGEGVEQDPALAAEWYRKAAEQGHPGAQHNLGVCYRNGTGVARDLHQAFEWFRRAAEQGDVDAQCNLGVHYHHGEGVERDPAQAFAWYSKAAAQEDAAAQSNVGECYRDGVGVERDLARAAEWYRKAAEQGCAEAQHNLGVLYRDGSGVERDLAQSEEWLRKAAEQGYEPGSAVTLAR